MDSKQSFKPDVYAILNSRHEILEKLGQSHPVNELIQLIKENNHGYREPLVMDLGCGTGSITKLLAKEVNPERIVGVDFDANAIAFAKQHNAMANTDYYVQDFAQEWNRWDKSVQKLAGKVSLIVSNFALHWVGRESDTAAQNMAKLLSNKGIMIVNIPYCGDIYRSVDSDRRAVLERRLRYPSERQLIGQWVTAFTSAGFTRIDIIYRETKRILPVKVFSESIQLPINWFKRFLTDSTGDEDMDEVIRDLIFKERVRAVSEKSPNGEDQVQVNGQVWNFVVKK